MGEETENPLSFDKIEKELAEAKPSKAGNVAPMAKETATVVKSGVNQAIASKVWRIRRLGKHSQTDSNRERI